MPHKKAYHVFDVNNSDECSDIVHAISPGQAKMIWDWYFDVDFLDTRVRRVPELDDKPINDETVFNSGRFWIRCSRCSKPIYNDPIFIGDNGYCGYCQDCI